MRFSFGYILGTFLILPIIFWLVNTFYLKGNNVSVEQIQDYIEHSIEVTLQSPKRSDYDNNGERALIYQRENYLRSLQWKGGFGTKRTFTFFESSYQKYFQIISFDGFELWEVPTDDGFTRKNGKSFIIDKSRMRHTLMTSSRLSISGKVNQVQWKDSTYGTKENPYPVFSYKLVVPEEGDSEEIFDVSFKANVNFVQEYLNRFIGKEAFKKLNLNNK